MRHLISSNLEKVKNGEEEGVEGKGQKGEKGKSVQEVRSLYDTI